MTTLKSKVKLVSKLVSTLSKDNVVHSYHDEEKQSLVEHLNFLLQNEVTLKSRIPIDPKSDLIFDSLKDGIILCKLINAIKPGTLNESSLKLNATKLNLFEMNVNLEKCLAAAKSIGCSIINIGPVDFQEGKRHLILAILWQLIKIDLLNKVSKLASRVRAEILDLGEKEKVDDLVADEILIRWVNHHLIESKATSKRITNFSSDIKDCEVYIVLFHQLSPKTCSLNGLKTEDLLERAKEFLDMIDRINCKKFISPQDIVSGNGRLNIAFVAYLFNRFNQVKEEAPVVPSEAIKAADEKIQNNIEEIQLLEKEIQLYQDRNLEKVKYIEEIQERIEQTKIQNQELEERFEEKVEIYKKELEDQRSDFQVQIKLLEEQLKLVDEQVLPSEDELIELIEKERQEIKAIEENSVHQLENTLESIKLKTNELEQENKRLVEEKDSGNKELIELKERLEQEKVDVIKKLDSTGYMETKKKLEEVKQQAKVIETQISDLKETEKELKVTLTEAKDDKHRISLAKKKIQDELTRAKENTEKVIKSRFETDRHIDRTTKQVKDLQYEVDRIKNDRVYIHQQTQVLRVEVVEAEEQLEDISVEKKRVLQKKKQIQENLMEKEIELDQVLIEKEEKIQDTKKQHREVVDKMKRTYEITKRETQDDKNRIKEKLINDTSILLTREYEAETEKRQVELHDYKNRQLESDIRFQSLEIEVLESEMVRTTKEHVKVTEVLYQEREINKILEEKNRELWKEKSSLRENTTKAVIESYHIQKENRDNEVKAELLNEEAEDLTYQNSKIQMNLIEEKAELDLKKAEVKDEKRRMKRLLSQKKLEEKEKLDKLEFDYSRDLVKLKSFEEIKSKDIQDSLLAAEDLELKTNRMNDRLNRTQLEIDSITNKFESLDTKKLADKKLKLENTIAIAMGIIDDKKKDKDQVLKEFEVASHKQKLLSETLHSHSKTKKSTEQKKKELEERLAKLKSHSSETTESHKKWVEEQDHKSKLEREKIKKELDKEQSRIIERLENQMKEEQEAVIKKQESTINKISENIQKSKKEEERLLEKIQIEKDEIELALERKKRKDERGKKKLQKQIQQEEENE